MFNCEECNKSYVTYVGFKNHLKIKHQINDFDINAKIYKCDYCNIILNYWQSKRPHEQICKRKLVIKEKIKELNHRLKVIETNQINLINHYLINDDNNVIHDTEILNSKNVNCILKELSKKVKKLEKLEKFRPRGFDDLIDEIPEDEKPDFLKKPNNSTKSINELNKLYGSDSESLEQSEDESESDEEDESGEYVEIKVKGQMYILEGNLMYTKTKKGTKGELYGTYSNGKVKKLAGKKPKSAKSEIEV